MQTLQSVYFRASFLVVALLLGEYSWGIPASVSYRVVRTRSVTAHVVFVDLDDRDLLVTPAIAYNRPGRRQTFSSFLAEHNPYAQLTGSYFGMGNALPVGDIVINSRLQYDGFVGSALAISPENRAEIIDIPYRWRYSWPGYQSVIQGGIRLVRDGKRYLSPRDQGFHDPALYRHASRTAVGITASNKLMLVAVTSGVQLSQLAEVMRSLGACDAMTLDGGGSTGLAYQGSIIVAPHRALSNVLMVMPRPHPVATPAPPTVPEQLPSLENGEPEGSPVSTVLDEMHDFTNLYLSIIRNSGTVNLGAYPQFSASPRSTSVGTVCRKQDRTDRCHNKKPTILKFGAAK